MSFKVLHLSKNQWNTIFPIDWLLFFECTDTAYPAHASLLLRFFSFRPARHTRFFSIFSFSSLLVFHQQCLHNFALHSFRFFPSFFPPLSIRMCSDVLWVPHAACGAINTFVIIGQWAAAAAVAAFRICSFIPGVGGKPCHVIPYHGIASPA